MNVHNEVFRIDRDFAYNGFSLYHYIDDSTYGRKVAVAMKMEDASRSVILPRLAVLDDDQAQTIMNDLWLAGVRPGEGLVEPRNSKHMDEEIDWLRSKVDFLIER